MAVTVTLVDPVPSQVNGRLREVVVQITGDTAYPTNGYAIDPRAVMGIAVVQHVGIGGPSATGIVPAWDYANQKLKLFWCAGAGAVMTEITNGTNVSTMVCRAVFRGL